MRRPHHIHIVSHQSRPGILYRYRTLPLSLCILLFVTVVVSVWLKFILLHIKESVFQHISLSVWILCKHTNSSTVNTISFEEIYVIVLYTSKAVHHMYHMNVRKRGLRKQATTYSMEKLLPSFFAGVYYK